MTTNPFRAEEPGLFTCRACERDVSVPAGKEPRCPRCGGPLDLPAAPEGEAPDRTLLAVSETASTLVEDPPDRAPPQSLPTVKALGPFQLRRVLGKGGMGVVYEAFQPALSRTVALKVMSDEEAGEEELARFEREARAAARLQHPNIVPIHEVGVEGGRRYFTMDLVRGQTLQALARQGQLGPERAARLVAKVAHAIHHAHEQGIIHRDLKPSNIIVDEETGEPRVTDFGLAKDLSDVSGLTLTGVAMGSPPYMPPEQARGEFKLVDAVSDVYGLGAVLYECLTRAPPFSGKSVYDIIARVLVEEPEAPRKKDPSVPYDLETICLKALEKEKWRRYQSARDLARDLERHLEGHTIRAARQGLTTRIGRGLARHRQQLFAAGVPLVVVAALLALQFGPTPPEDKPIAAEPPPRIAPSLLRQAAEQMGAVNYRPALSLVLRLSARVGPDGRELAPVGGAEALAAVESRLSGRAREVARARFAREGELPLEALDLALRELLALRPEERPDPGSFARLAAGWAAGAGEPVRALVRRAALAAAVDAAAGDLPGLFEEVADTLADGPPGPLDLPLLRLCDLRLPAGRAAELARAAGIDPAAIAERPAPDEDPPAMQVRAPPGTGAALDRWRFPHLPPREVLGLLAPGQDPEWLRPTRPQRTPDGRRVLVGWLRFLHLLDDADGRVLDRVRLPGPAVGLEVDPEGAVVVAAVDDATLRLRVALAGDQLALTWPDGAPLRPLEQLPTDERIARDELRRAAFSELEAGTPLLLDDRVRVWTEGASRPEARAMWTPPSPGPLPPLRRLDWELSQGPETPRIGAVIATVGSGLVGWVQPGDRLLGLSLPVFDLERRERRDPARDVVLLLSRGGREVLRAYAPARPPIAPAELLALRERAAAAARRDGNPWILAVAGVADARAAEWIPERAAELRQESRARLEAAARSRQLVPGEQVELACWLDRLGHEGPADLALEDALARLVEDHAFLPEWAGYGRLDGGIALARRAEEAWFVGGASPRARALAGWRDAFAPVLVESPAAREALLRAGDPDAAPVSSAVPVLPHGEPLSRGVAGLDARALHRIDLAVRLQTSFVLGVGGLIVIFLVRHRRHALRDLERIGVRTAGDRWRMWRTRPLTRIGFSWPTYVTLNDKLALILLYVTYFAAFGVQDAGFEALAALRRAPVGLQAGIPAERESLERLERASAGWEPAGEPLVPGEPAALLSVDAALRALPPGERTATAIARRLAQEEPRAGWRFDAVEAELVRLAERGLAARVGSPDPDLLYARAWAKQAGGAPTEEVRRAWRDVLALRRDAPALVGLAEVLATSDPVAAVRLVEEAHALDPGLPAVHLLRARLTRAEPDERQVEAAARGSRRLALQRLLGSRLGGPLAPPPGLAARDQLLVGTARWSSVIPARTARDLIVPVSGEVDASLLAFNRAWNLNLEFARLRNQFFWLVPASLVCLLISLFVTSPRWFEPLPSDLAPPFGVRLLAALVPGVPQFMRGRSVRGVLLLLPAYFLGQTLYHSAWLGRAPLLGEFQELTFHLSAAEQAALTGESVAAIPLLRLAHLVELTLALAVVYLLHWIDLALAARRQRRAEPARGSTLIPLETASSLTEIGLPPDTASGSGPFDQSAS